MFLPYFCSNFPPLLEVQWKQAVVIDSGSFTMENTVYFNFREREVFSLVLLA